MEPGAVQLSSFAIFWFSLYHTFGGCGMLWWQVLSTPATPARTHKNKNKNQEPDYSFLPNTRKKGGRWHNRLPSFYHFEILGKVGTSLPGMTFPFFFIHMTNRFATFLSFSVFYELITMTIISLVSYLGCSFQKWKKYHWSHTNQTLFMCSV